MTEQLVEIWTDGACLGNPGPGGWAAILTSGDKYKELFGSSFHTTNNRMELTAVITALGKVNPNARVIVYSDSQYVTKGASVWLSNYKRRNWRTANNKKVLNKDLWQKLDALLDGRKIVWRWIRGHEGVLHNERCDKIARDQARQAVLKGTT